MCKNAWKKLEICEKIFLGKGGLRKKCRGKSVETPPVEGHVVVKEGLCKKGD